VTLNSLTNCFYNIHVKRKFHSKERRRDRRMFSKSASNLSVMMSELLFQRLYHFLNISEKKIYLTYKRALYVTNHYKI
jgi:hypothetical protein